MPHSLLRPVYTLMDTLTANDTLALTVPVCNCPDHARMIDLKYELHKMQNKSRSQATTPQCGILQALL